MLTFSQFKFHLARYAEVSEADAELFMNTVTQVLLEQLKAGEEVAIQGLGTFSVVETQQGRRLAFQVDDKMRAQVNAPFACFEPMTLAVKKETPSTPATPSQPPRGEESVPAEETTIVEEPAPVAEESAPVVEESPEAEEVAAPTEEPTPAEESVAEEPALKEEPAPEPAEPELVAQSEPAAETPSAPVAPVVPPTPGKTPEAKTPAATPQPKPRPTKKVEPTWQEQLVEKLKLWLEKAEQQWHLKPWMLGAIAGGVFIILLVIIFAVSCGGSKSKPAPQAPDATEAVSDSISDADSTEVEDVAIDAASAKTAAKQDKSAKATKAAPQPAKATPAKSTTRRSGGSYVNSSPFTSDEKPSPDILMQEGGRPKQVKLSEGERLTLLALEHYGDKAFWAYIYDVNAFQLGDPNNVPTTVSLYLPDPTYFKIDANNPASVKRAQNRAMQILNDKQEEGPWGRR
ncbi:MAG: HU family DNA-binding protein [Bacteroidales bacterium]|nr:HU family DNA-binding protein [Bacteroidales bacterium]